MITKLRDYLQTNKKLLAATSAAACIMFVLSSIQSPTNITHTKRNKTLQQLYSHVLANLASSQSNPNNSSLAQQKTLELYHWLNIGKQVGLYFSEQLLSEHLKNDPYTLQRIRKPSSNQNNHRDTLLFASSILNASILQEAILSTRLIETPTLEQETHMGRPLRSISWAELKTDTQSTKNDSPVSQADIEDFYHNQISAPLPTIRASGVSIDPDKTQRIPDNEHTDMHKKVLDLIDETLLNEPENIEGIAERFGKKVKPVQSTHVLKTLQKQYLNNELAINQIAVTTDSENRIHISKLNTVDTHHKPPLKSLESSITRSIQKRNHENRLKSTVMRLEKTLNEEQLSLTDASIYPKVNIHRSTVDVSETNIRLPTHIDANMLSAQLQQKPGRKIAYTQKTKTGWLIIQLNEVDFHSNEKSADFSYQADAFTQAKEIYFLTKGLLK